MLKKSSQKYFDNAKDDMIEMAKDERNLIVIEQLLVNVNIGEVTTGLKHVLKEQDKPASTFSHIE